MLNSLRENKDIFLVTILILLSRIPFLFSGYGSEEDAWGLILVASHISLTGIYEVSRFPGHPVQELMLSHIWSLPSWILNLLTAMVSSGGVCFFMLYLKNIHNKNFIPAGIMLAFTPVFYINSSNIMDYTWAISLVILSLYFLNKKKILVAGIVLGIACGFRITAGAMLFPFTILLLQEDDRIKNILLFISSTVITAAICFLPPWLAYGKEFFTYYNYFPYPPLLKNIYKGTIGAWGIVGSIVIITGGYLSFRQLLKINFHINRGKKNLLLASCLTITLYIFSFIQIPQKTAFIIPLIPFIIIIFSELLNSKQMVVLSSLMVISCFFIGVNLDDPIRGSSASFFAYKTDVGETPVTIDILQGLVTADLSKRNQKIAYASSIVQKLSLSTSKKTIIAGWWQNEMKYFSLKYKNPLVSYLYYADENELRDSIAAGSKIFYLPEQDFYNDLRFKKSFTQLIAIPLN